MARIDKAVNVAKDIRWLSFVFPKGFPLTKHLVDMLDNNVDSKYYVSPDGYESNGIDDATVFDDIIRIGTMTKVKGFDIMKRVYGAGGCSPCIPAHTSGTIPKVIINESYC